MPPEINPPIENDINALFLNDQQLERTSDWSKKKMELFKLAIAGSTWASRFNNSVSGHMNPSDVYPPAFNLIVPKSYNGAYADLKASQTVLQSTESSKETTKLSRCQCCL